MYVPTMIFGHLLTSSNYDDTEKKVTGIYNKSLHNIIISEFNQLLSYLSLVRFKLEEFL